MHGDWFWSLLHWLYGIGYLLHAYLTTLNRGIGLGSKTTATRILDAATQVLVEHGIGLFTMRRAAEKAGISVGNLTYHFPSRDDLIRGVIRQGFAVFESRLEAALNPGRSPVERLKNALKFTIEWGSDEDTLRFQREAWALALHDRGVRSIVDRFYEAGIELLKELFREINPEAPEAQVALAVTVFALISEGTPILNARLYPGLAPAPDLADGANTMILRILGSPQDRKTKPRKQTRICACVRSCV